MINFIKEITLCILLFAVFGIIIYSNTYKWRKDKEKNLHLQLMSKNNRLYNFITDLITTTNFEDQLNNLISYELFKESCIDIIYSKLNDRLDNCNNYDWLNLSKNNNDIITDKFILDCASEILNSDELDRFFLSIFVNKVNKNIKESEKIEQDAIEYNKKFGEDSDELHPKEEQEKNNNDDEEQDKSINDLIDTGTIEDIEE